MSIDRWMDKENVIYIYVCVCVCVCVCVHAASAQVHSGGSYHYLIFTDKDIEAH